MMLKKFLFLSMPFLFMSDIQQSTGTAPTISFMLMGSHLTSEDALGTFIWLAAFLHARLFFTFAKTKQEQQRSEKRKQSCQKSFLDIGFIQIT
jgi:hypothetical protein